MSNKTINRQGIKLTYHKDIYNKRSDMCNYLTHLTKPTIEDIENINKKNLDDYNKIREINLRAVDNLIRILKEECIYGSGKDGYIINGTNKTATCFQDIPFINLKENVDESINSFIKNSTNKLRYCGVGIAFSKFTIYKHGGRPVIYEEADKAKELLHYNENEYWRIVNLKLELDEPIEYEVEPCDINIEFSDYEQQNSNTKIIDFMYEREWRIPYNFKFNIDEDVTFEKNMYLIFPTKYEFDYFNNQMLNDYIEQNKMFEKYDEEYIYQDDKLENIKKYGISYYYDKFDNSYYIPMDELYKDKFLREWENAKLLDSINLESKLCGYNKNKKIKIIILNDLIYTI